MTTYSKYFARGYKAAEKRGKFEGLTYISTKNDTENEDMELYDELWNCYLKGEFTKEAEMETWDGIFIRLNSLKNNKVKILESLKEYIDYQETRKD